MALTDFAKSTAIYHASEHRLVIEILLSPQEAALFGLLARAHGRIVPTDIQTSELWPISADEPKDADNTRAAHLHNLRTKLAPCR